MMQKDKNIIICNKSKKQTIINDKNTLFNIIQYLFESVAKSY
jgi:hypothetical protein